MRSFRLIAFLLLLPTGTNALRAVEPMAATSAVDANKIKERRAVLKAAYQNRPAS